MAMHRDKFERIAAIRTTLWTYLRWRLFRVALHAITHGATPLPPRAR